jgi:hypothetical protein
MVNQVLETSQPCFLIRSAPPRLCASIVFLLPYPLPSSVFCNSFVCHSYKNTRGYGAILPILERALRFKQLSVLPSSRYARLAPSGKELFPCP